MLKIEKCWNLIHQHKNFYVVIDLRSNTLNSVSHVVKQFWLLIYDHTI